MLRLRLSMTGSENALKPESQNWWVATHPTNCDEAEHRHRKVQEAVREPPYGFAVADAPASSPYK